MVVNFTFITIYSLTVRKETICAKNNDYLWMFGTYFTGTCPLYFNKNNIACIFLCPQINSLYVQYCRGIHCIVCQISICCDKTFPTITIIYFVAAKVMPDSRILLHTAHRNRLLTLIYMHSFVRKLAQYSYLPAYSLPITTL